MSRTPKTPKARMEWIKEYNAEWMQQVCLKLHRKYDMDIIEHLSEQQSKNGYLKQLIREDIERKHTDGIR